MPHSFSYYISGQSLLKAFCFFSSSLLCYKALALSLIWYSGPAVLSSLSLGNLSLRKLSYTLFFSSSGCWFVDGIRSGTSFPCGLIPAALEYFDHLWVTNTLLLQGLQNALLFSLRLSTWCRTPPKHLHSVVQGGKVWGRIWAGTCYRISSDGLELHPKPQNPKKKNDGV